VKKLFFLVAICSLVSFEALALPMDWHGVFAVDSATIDSYRRIEETEQQTTGPGTQEYRLASGQHASARFQSYVLRLAPEIIVNDSSTFKAELTTGYGRGGRLGDSSTTDQSGTGTGSMGNALYYYNTNAGGSSPLQVSQFNMILYSDTATYIIGRHTYHWGVGAVINDGHQIWDRQMYIRDGLTAKFKIGNFDIAPFFSKVSSAESLTRATRASEYGASLLYDNPDKDIAFGLYYSKKQNNAFNGTVVADIQNTGAATPLGKTNTKLTDFYLKKSFGKTSVAGEVPILSGEIGHLYNSTSVSKYGAKAFIFEAKHELSDNTTFFANIGHVSGHSGVESSYDAMYLNPNYQIANLLFRYNLMAVGDSSRNVFDSYITNAKYFKFGSTLRSERASWNFAAIYAIANETAVANTKSYNHDSNRLFNATTSQSNKLGTELDVDFDYRWNNETHLGSSLGYLFTGDYYAFTNTATENTPKNSFVILFKSSLEF